MYYWEDTMDKLSQIKELEEIFAKKTRVTDKVQEASAVMLGLEHAYDFGTGTKSTQISGSDKTGVFFLESHLFVHKVLPYGFVLHAVVSKRYSSNVQDTANVASRVYELEYNLRDKVSKLTKNGKPLSFSESNIRNMFSGHTSEEIVNKLDELGGTDMYSSSYDSIGCIGDEQVSMVSRFLARLMKYNKIELIYKSGVPREFALRYAEAVVKEGEGVNTWYSKSASWLSNKETNPAKHLGVPKAIFKVICEGYLSWNAYCSLVRTQQIRLSNYDETDKEYIKRQQLYTKFGGVLYSLSQYCKELDEQYGIKKASSFISNEWSYIYDRMVCGKEFTPFYENSICELAKSANLDLNRAIRYAYYQTYIEQGMTACRTTINIYKDYLRTSSYMSDDPIKYPKALKTAHDVAVMNYELVKDELLAEKFSKAVASYKHLETKGGRGEYIVVTPESVEDLAKEGTDLHHCVFTYARQVADSDTQILFLRNKETPEESLVTFEVKGGSIIQARGLNNRDLHLSEVKYLKKWADNHKIRCSVGGFTD